VAPQALIEFDNCRSAFTIENEFPLRRRLVLKDKAVILFVIVPREWVWIIDPFEGQHE